MSWPTQLKIKRQVITWCWRYAVRAPEWTAGWATVPSENGLPFLVYFLSRKPVDLTMCSIGLMLAHITYGLQAYCFSWLFEQLKQYVVWLKLDWFDMLSICCRTTNGTNGVWAWVSVAVLMNIVGTREFVVLTSPARSVARLYLSAIICTVIDNKTANINDKNCSLFT